MGGGGAVLHTCIRFQENCAESVPQTLREICLAHLRFHRVLASHRIISPHLVNCLHVNTKRNRKAAVPASCGGTPAKQTFQSVTHPEDGQQGRMQMNELRKKKTTKIGLSEKQQAQQDGGLGVKTAGLNGLEMNKQVHLRIRWSPNTQHYFPALSCLLWGFLSSLVVSLCYVSSLIHWVSSAKATKEWYPLQVIVGLIWFFFSLSYGFPCLVVKEKAGQDCVSLLHMQS